MGYLIMRETPQTLGLMYTLQFTTRAAAEKYLCDRVRDPANKWQLGDLTDVSDEAILSIVGNRQQDDDPVYVALLMYAPLPDEVQVHATGATGKLAYETFLEHRILPTPAPAWEDLTQAVQDQWRGVAGEVIDHWEDFSHPDQREHFDGS